MRRSCSIISVKNRFLILKNIRCFEVFVVGSDWKEEMRENGMHAIDEAFEAILNPQTFSLDCRLKPFHIQFIHSFIHSLRLNKHSMKDETFTVLFLQVATEIGLIPQYCAFSP